MSHPGRSARAARIALLALAAALPLAACSDAHGIAGPGQLAVVQSRAEDPPAPRSCTVTRNGW